MNVTTRNFLRLLRAGAFQTDEPLEPLSVWKWRQLYQLSLMHGVSTQVYEGICRCQQQFFVSLIPQELLQLWQQAAQETPPPAGAEGASQPESEDDELLQPYKLTNPLLNRRLQAILDDEHSTLQTRSLLVLMLSIARYLLNEGIPVRLLVELGQVLRQTDRQLDTAQLQSWISELKFTQFARLEANLLIQLLHFKPEECTFLPSPIPEIDISPLTSEMFRLRQSVAHDWQFSQGKSIFVHTTNSSALLWHIRRSARYFKYYPQETVTNFMASFAHSLSHIEE